MNDDIHTLVCHRLIHPTAKPAVSHALTGHSLSVGRSYMKAESPHARGPSPIDFDGLSFPSIGARERREDTEESRAARIERIAEAVRVILVGIGEDPNREGLLKTPERYAKALMFFSKGYEESVTHLMNKALFQEDHDEMVIVKNIDVFSLCEHHMVPFTGKIHIGYIPQNGKVVGLSKIARLAEMFSRRLQVQERLTKQVAMALQELLSPQGVAVVMEASTKAVVVNPGKSSPTVPPSTAPALESNSASRHIPLFQQQHVHRTSRLPNAGLNPGRIRDQLPELSSSSSAESAKLINTSKSTRSLGADQYPIAATGLLPSAVGPTSRCWDRTLSFQDDNVSNCTSGTLRSKAASFLGSANDGTGNLFELTATGEPSATGNSSLPLGPAVDLPEYGIDDAVRAYSGMGSPTLTAAISIQRAVRRFLNQKHARPTNNPRLEISTTTANIAERYQKSDTIVGSFSSKDATSSTHISLDLESLEKRCILQASEIKQLKELVAKMMQEAAEDRRRLEQRDREIEDLIKQQKSTALPTSMSSSRFGHTHSFRHGSASMATSSTVPSFNTFGYTGMASSSGDDSFHSSATNGSPALAERVVGGVIGIVAEDLNDPTVSYTTQTNSGAVLHALSISSRPNSSTAIQPQSSHPGLNLKINTNIAQSLHSNQQSFYHQQCQGLMDMVDSPSSSDFGTQDMVTTPSSYGSGRGLAGSRHGYSSQTSFSHLNHRNSGSFSSSSRAFDSPSEQQSPYPWNVQAGLSHSQSWVDDMNAGYGYEVGGRASGQFHHGGMGQPIGYDPQLINQQYSHVGQLQQQQSPHNQGMPSYRNNYRRHGEKPVHLDYQMCVDRILQATDQQASIHLQQKLKTSPPEQKVQIIDAILGQAYPLMSNRFGNFLIQRCFEFGSPQQIDALAQAMRGNILTLACDPFGCHVVQKALDNVEEDCKARIVTEMFRRIRETIVHRYACHVWQKVFEIRWTDAPPAVMTYVNNAVAGRWASVAVDETGSLVVQNVFENCAEHDKRPVLNEILQSVTTIAKGQWGNWVIQHILEHGAPADRAIVTQKILEDAVNLSLDQYASKVVEKTLRMAALFSSPAVTVPLSKTADESDSKNTGSDNGGTGPLAPTVIVHGKTIQLTQEDVMGQYIQIVCDGVPDRPRIPLIDIAADQYGNYIIQYILTNAGPHHRETCAALIKRHMVSLRGSKYGQKVAFMVERWRGSPYSGSHANSSNLSQGVGSSSSGHHSYGSKTVSGSSLDSGSASGRRRW
ncbi:hypothetical protein KVV02_005262 [Mortierella alpina]|uniref:GTP cyclohydrolase 1 n=1 Tax=Mortierella alpina TaxID=64518 RepID=A0A9P8A1M1_MORAP|nr:hypothetical protein KVV02_005262 [Mortierella alpina]